MEYISINCKAEFANLVGEHTHSSKCDNHVLDEQVFEKGYEFTIAISPGSTLLFNGGNNKEFATEVLVIIVERSHAVSNMENVCQFSVGQEL